jgi:hypothetical protein
MPRNAGQVPSGDFIITRHGAAWTPAMIGKRPSRSASQSYAPLHDTSGDDRSTKLGSTVHLEEGLLRAVTLEQILQGGARLFAQGGAAAREDPEGTFALSKPVAVMDVFISHAWSTPRVLKYLALISHFNLARAVKATAAAVAIVFVYELCFWTTVPAWSISEGIGSFIDGHHEDVGTLCTFIPSAVLIAALTLAHRLGAEQRHCFLDICCIAQTDASLKARGIEALGALLDRSETMVALVDENCTPDIAPGQRPHAHTQASPRHSFARWRTRALTAFRSTENPRCRASQISLGCGAHSK